MGPKVLPAIANSHFPVKGPEWSEDHNTMVPFDSEILAIIKSTEAWSKQYPPQEPDQLRQIQDIAPVVAITDRNLEELGLKAENNIKSKATGI